MKRNTIRALVLGTLPAWSVTQALAQTPTEALVVTATRTAQTPDTSLGQTIVITRKDIDSAGDIGLAQLLRIFANSDVRATGGAGQPSSVFLRGSNSTHALVLVDGMRVNSATLGATAIEALPLDLIERIEIVKGPFSGLYGSDALGGVIQIFTRGENVPVLRGNAGVGNRGAAQISAGLSVQEGGTAFNINAGIRNIKDVSATRPEAPFGIHNPDRDKHQVAHGNFSVSQSFRNGETLTLSAFQSDAKSDFDAGTNSSGDQNRQKLSSFQFESKNELAPGWKSQLRAGRSEDDQHLIGAFPSRFKTVQDQFSWVNEFANRGGHMLVGVDALKEKVSGTGTYVVSQRNTNSVFAGYLERLGDQHLEFSLRRDEEDQFGARSTGSVGYGVTLSPSLRIFAKGGRAFRAPSFSDLYLPDDPMFGPSSNPLLKPEKSKSAEIGVQWKAGAQAINATVFDNRIDDLVSFVFGSGPQNINRARIRGLEIDFITQFMGANIRTAFTHQRPRDEDTGKRLRSRARSFGSVSADRSWGRWRGSVTVVATGDRFDSATEAPASRMGGFSTLDANIRYQVDTRWSVALGLNNIADKRYELAQGYNAPGRQALLTVSFNAK